MLIVICSFYFVAFSSHAQKVIFLHHSTGSGVYYEGSVENWITNYNAENNTNIEISETNYPDSPWPWENYPYDYWKLWVDGACNSNETGIECLSTLTQKYDVIIFKHCFPGASIQADNSEGDIASGEKTLPNYKLQYSALRELFDEFPDNKFIAWTLAPLHRLATNNDEAKRANEFANWVKNEWLSEDGKEHPNIFVFDFYGLAAEMETNPAKGKQFCLKYSYEGSHDDSDSHPNTLANQTIGPLFAQEIVDIALTSASNGINENKNKIAVIYPNMLKRGESFTVTGSADTPTTLTLFDLNGQKIMQEIIEHTSLISTEKFRQGIYLVSIESTNNKIIQRLFVK